MSGHHHLPDPLPHSPDGLSSGAERFVAFLRVSGWEVALLDDLLRPLFATSRAARILGLKGGSAEMDDPPREAILACFQGGEDGNLLHSGPEGEVVRLSFTRTMLDGSPHLLIAVGAGEDVSFQRTADKLRHKEARLGAALDLAKLGMYEWDLKTNEVILDARSREIFGFGPEEPIRAQDVFARIDPADFPRVHRAALDSIEKKERLRTEYRLLLPGDKRRLVISLSDVELGPDQTPVRVVGLFGDVTARRAAENALRESEDRQAFLLQLTDRLRNLSDPIAIQDEAVRHLAEHLRVDRGVYGEVETDDDDGVVVHRDYCRPGVRSAAGRYRFADFGSKIAESLRTGKTLWGDDVDQDGDLSDAEQAKYQEFRCGPMSPFPW
jgi:PAS domain-containing protein